jgi:hypothetical protein
MIRLILIAALVAAASGAPARAETLQAGRIEPFDVRPGDARSLVWLERWLSDNQPDDTPAYDQAMAYALSASERRQTRDTSIGASQTIPTSKAYHLAQSHLGNIHFMAEIRWSAALTNVSVPGIDDPARPRWQTRHLCAGTLIAADWVLSAGHCVTPAMLTAGIEVALGTSDLARDEGLVRPVDRIVARLGANLALLHLGGTAEGYAERRIAPAKLEVPPPPPGPEENNPLPGYSVLGWGRHIINGKPIAPWRYSVVIASPAQECAPPETAQAPLCLTNKALKFCREDSGGPVYSNASPQGAGLAGIVSWDQPDCFKPPVTEDQPDPAAPIILLAPYREWLEQAIAQNETGQARVIP